MTLNWKVSWKCNFFPQNHLKPAWIQTLLRTCNMSYKLVFFKRFAPFLSCTLFYIIHTYLPSFPSFARSPLLAHSRSVSHYDSNLTLCLCLLALGRKCRVALQTSWWQTGVHFNVSPSLAYVVYHYMALLDYTAHGASLINVRTFLYHITWEASIQTGFTSVKLWRLNTVSKGTGNGVPTAGRIGIRVGWGSPMIGPGVTCNVVNGERERDGFRCEVRPCWVSL